ncbi:bleomycin resistance protein [Virgibacillus profundi]|uniref:Bleomycin resistance protein n=1 Tax=Virgibacillus profundi TaxID=2024555 RepID=A0A2A2ID86_9BACI|nr:VOC family protein [Virgibacillus profundi]PAV29689.1 bleomycin resistance protein [Virgibacillus profundi]PXY53861.1 bleomycin resistance protein [Virgibacillus profundi]
MELTHTRLLVDNYKECFIFYRDILGFEVSWGDENSLYGDFQVSENIKLGLFERRQMVSAIDEEYRPALNAQDKTVLIFKVDNVDSKYKELLNKVEFITGPTEQQDWGIKVAHFRDPADNLVEIYEHLD